MMKGVDAALRCGPARGEAEVLFFSSKQKYVGVLVRVHRSTSNVIQSSVVTRTEVIRSASGFSTKKSPVPVPRVLFLIHNGHPQSTKKCSLLVDRTLRLFASTPPGHIVGQNIIYL